MRKLLFLLLLTATSLLAADPEKGTICFGTDCTPATGTAFDVKPADVERRFVWTGANGSTFILGTLPAKATAVDLQQKEAHNVTVAVRGDVQRGWPVETRFAIAAGKDSGWRWSVPAKVMAKPVSIRLLPGTYSMQIATEHHKPDRRPIKIDAADLAIQVILAPPPVVTGRVVTMKKNGDDKETKEVAVAGAQIAASDAKVIGSTNEQGAFHIEMTDPRTEELVISSPGLGARLLPLHITSVETDLGLIRLSSGVKLTIHIARADSVRSKPLHVQLTEASPAQYDNTNIATRELKAGDADLVFADLSEGEYYVTLSGDGPLEKLTTVIPIKAEDVSKEIRLRPFQLQGTVRLGNEPLRNGKVGVNERHHTWTAESPIDGEGHFGGPMWQSEGIGGWVSSKETGSLPVDRDPTLVGDPATWDITFRRRLISGRIFDADTKEPIPHAGLHLELETKSQSPAGQSGYSRLYSTLHVSDDGSYSIVATKDGIYDLAVTAPDHVSQKTTIEIAAEDESKTADFPLSKGIEQTIDFVWPNGDPVADAMVIEGVARDGHNPAWMGGTDPSGRLKMRMRAAETKTLFIVPKEGSFVVVHVVADETKPLRVVVPQPAASLVLTFKDAQQKTAGAFVAMRWNGEWVPGSVVGRLKFSRADGGGLRVSLLPAGSYELWGFRGAEPLFGPPPREPVHVGLSSGEQAVEIAVP
jgi:ABC-type amino acid transport substrate-binding protein